MKRRPFGPAFRWLKFGGMDSPGILASNSGTVLLLTIASGALGLLSQMVLTRSLGATEYGRYAVAISWCLALAAPATAGLDSSILRFAPRYIAERQGAQLRRFVEFAGLAQILVILLFGCAIFLTPLGRKILYGLDPDGLIWLLLFIGSSAFLASFSTFFIAFQSFTLSQLYQNFVRPILLLGAVLVIILAAKARLDANVALAITAVSSAAALVLLLLHIAWALHRFGGSGKASFHARAWLSFSGWAQLGSIGQQAVVQVPVILLGAFSTAAEAGHYAIAARLSVLVTLGLTSVGTASAPMISTACGRREWDKVAHLARIAARLATGASVLALIFFAFAGTLVLSLFGESFGQAYIPLLVLLAGACFNAFSGVNTILLSMTDQPDFAVKAILSGAVVNMTAAFLLIPHFGATGAAAGMAVGTVVSNLLMIGRLRYSLGIDSTAIGLDRLRGNRLGS